MSGVSAFTFQVPNAASQGYFQVTNLGTSVATTLPNIPTDGSVGYTVVYVEGNGVRWRDDSIDPTSTVGMPLSAGQAFPYSGDPHALRFISQTSTATLNITYYVGR